MEYILMSDEEIIKDLAMKVDQLRISHEVKESEIEELTGISRKTLYNFKQGKTGLSLKNLIKILRALNELDRLASLFPEIEEYVPITLKKKRLRKRVRDKREPEIVWKWGDER